MPLIYSDSLRSPFWLPNGHYQSIYPALFRKIIIPYKRERISTPDDDFLDLDWSIVNKSKTLVILSHGLEGDSTRQYITGMINLLNSNDYNCLAWNYRSCGGEMNLQPRFYHSGETSDLDLVVNHAIQKSYSNIVLMGFSLGGNVTLKYVGERGKSILPQITKSVVFSVPLNLAACSRHINKPQNTIYSWRFLNTLKPKIKSKSILFPEIFDIKQWNNIKTIWQFDDVYTGPLHGFKNAADYYEQSSSMNFIEQIAIPTLIVHAKNDPLVPYTSFPLDKFKSLPNVWLELTTEGGHCGFTPKQTSSKYAYWSELRALDFIRK